MITIVLVEFHYLIRENNLFRKEINADKIFDNKLEVKIFMTTLICAFKNALHCYVCEVKYKKPYFCKINSEIGLNWKAITAIIIK